MTRLCDYFAEFGEVFSHGKCRRIQTGFGTADLEACGACLRVCATGKDEVALAYVKLSLAEHLLNFADEPPQIVWLGDGAAGAPLPYFREMRVERAINLTPRMRRLTLSGSNLARFTTGGLHVRLLIPRTRNAKPVWPVMGADGRPQWPAGEDRHDVRIYTLRRVDAERGEVDIDFVMHPGADGPGAQFAANALPGDVVGMTGPGGGSVPASDWCLLAGDETALPAIARTLEELPADRHAVVRIEVADRSEIQPLPERDGLDVEWLFRNDMEAGVCNLLEQALRSVIWPTDGRSIFAWIGCEFGEYLNIRNYLRNDLRLARNQHLAVAYWRAGKTICE